MKVPSNDIFIALVDEKQKITECHLAAQIILGLIMVTLYRLGAAVQAALLIVSTITSCSTRGWSPPLARVPQPVTRAATSSWVRPGSGRHTGDTAGVKVRAWASWITATS